MGGHRASGAGDDLVDGPVDLAAVRADDALLDAIAGGAGRADLGPGYGFGAGTSAADQADDERIAAILAAWRADIEADPMPELVGLDDAVEAVTAGHEARDRVRSRARRRMPFAVAAAAAVLAIAGMTVAVHGSKPGDALFGVNKVFFAEHAAEVAQVEEVRSNLERADAAVRQGDREGARRALEAAGLGLPQVPAPERPSLETERDRVEGSLTQPPSSSSRTAPQSPSSTTGRERQGAPDATTPDSEGVDPRTVPDSGTLESPEGPTSPDVETGTPGETTDTREAPASPPAPTTTTTPPTSSSTTPN